METITTEPNYELMEIVKCMVLIKHDFKNDTSQFSIDVLEKADLILQEYDKYLNGNKESEETIHQIANYIWNLKEEV